MRRAKSRRIVRLRRPDVFDAGKRGFFRWRLLSGASGAGVGTGAGAAELGNSTGAGRLGGAALIARGEGAHRRPAPAGARPIFFTIGNQFRYQTLALVASKSACMVARGRDEGNRHFFSAALARGLLQAIVQSIKNSEVQQDDQAERPDMPGLLPDH